MTVGERIRIMDLGRIRGDRQVYPLSHYKQLEGNNRVRALIDDGVVRDRGSPKTNCLNFISVWSTDAVVTIVGMPLILSILSCIVWPAVAVLKYVADVQTSVQTGVTIASFALTASKSQFFIRDDTSGLTNTLPGALLTALVAFLDSTGSREPNNGSGEPERRDYNSRERERRGERSRGRLTNLSALRSGKGRFRVVRSKNI